MFCLQDVLDLIFLLGFVGSFALRVGLRWSLVLFLALVTDRLSSLDHAVSWLF